MVSDHTPFPLHINQISTLPLPQMLIKIISQVTIPARTLAVVPTTFTSPPKTNCYYDLIGTWSITSQDLFILPLLKIFSTKLPTNLLCTIINISPNHITSPTNRHIGELTPLNHNYTTVKTASENEIMHIVKTNAINVNQPPHDN